LLSEGQKTSAAAAQRIQRDVYLQMAVMQRDRIVAWLGEMPVKARPTQKLLRALKTWDGNYDAQSEGALAFELLLFHLARALVAPGRQTAYEAVWGTRALIWEDMVNTPADTRQPSLARAARKATRDFRGSRNWGTLH